MKKQEFKKNEERLRNLWDNFNSSNIQNIGMPEGEEEEQEIENLFEKIMKENFTNLAKEIDFQEVQEAQRGARKKYSKSWKARTYIQDYSIQQSCHLEWKDRLKCFPDKVKFKEFIITKPLLYEMLKGVT